MRFALFPSVAGYIQIRCPGNEVVSVHDKFRAGRKILDPVLQRHGFTFVEGDSGESNGGAFMSGYCVHGDRRLELHFRHSLGLVTYHIESWSVEHEAYMRALLGRGGETDYSGFSEDPLDSFRGLRSDLERYCSDFLAGSGEEFER